VLTTEEGERWNRSEGAPEAQFVHTHEGDPSQPAGTDDFNKKLDDFLGRED